MRNRQANSSDFKVLPEYHLTNWLPNDENFYEICKSSENYLSKYQELARALNICIVPGTIIRTRTPTDAYPQSLENVTHFISNDGTILGSYAKKNLWGPAGEQNHLASGHPTPNQTIDTPLGKVGLLICWDLAFPEAYREVIRSGAKIIIMPTFYIRSGASKEGRAWNPSAPALFLDTTLIARAYENTCAIVFANAAGRPGGEYIGLSQVTVPYVGPLARLGNAAEGMAVADLDMKVVEDAEKNSGARGYLLGGGLDAHDAVRREKL